MAVADGKGRFAIPVTMRRLLKDDSPDNILCISFSQKFGCGTGFGPSHMDQLAQDIAREEENAVKRGTDFDYQRAWQEKFGMVEQVVFDDGGRFTLPPVIRKLAGIEDLIFFSGAGRHFEIWNPHRLLADESVFPPLKAAAEYLLDEWDANPKNPKNGGGK